MGGVIVSKKRRQDIPEKAKSLLNSLAQKFPSLFPFPFVSKKANRTFKKLSPCVGGMGGSAAEGQSRGGLEMGGGKERGGKREIKPSSS